MVNSNIVAYTITQSPPLPYRFKSSVLRLQIPDLGLQRVFPNSKFFRVMRESDTWMTLKKIVFTLRTWSRRTIWGDRACFFAQLHLWFHAKLWLQLFLQFHGPTMILLQTRASRLSDVLTARDVNEVANAEAGVVHRAENLSSKSSPEEGAAQIKGPTPRADRPTHISIATVGKDGQVKFEETGDLSTFSR